MTSLTSIDDAPVRRRRVPWWAYTVAALVAVAGLVAAFGGFADVPVQKLPTIAVGETWRGGEASAVVHGVYLSDTLPTNGTRADDGEVFLIVEATAETTKDAPSLFSRNLIRVFIDDVVSADTDPDRVVELRSGEGSGFLQPGIPSRVAYAWKVKAEALSVGDDVIIGVFDQFAVKGDPLWGDTSFTGPTPVARVLTSIDRLVTVPAVVGAP
ncbi:MAG: hypothetical protein ACOH1T_06020 [Microbacteriaceae bacterium]